jgi:hypothetical protein
MYIRGTVLEEQTDSNSFDVHYFDFLDFSKFSLEKQVELKTHKVTKLFMKTSVHL